MIRLASAALCLTLPALHAAAQSADGDGLAFAFEVGAGLGTVPGYFGSDEGRTGVALDFELGYTSLGGLTFGTADVDTVRQGFGFRGAFRYIPERTSDDFPELAGLDDIDAAFELGGGVNYAEPWWEVFAVGRYGIGGHDSLVGEVGMDLIARPTERLALRAGPRLLIGSGDYAATYFDVTPGEAAVSDFPAFEAEDGVMSSGIELSADYRFSDSWGMTATARFDRLQGDAADSPITAEDDQVSASLLVTRRFAFGF